MKKTGIYILLILLAAGGIWWAQKREDYAKTADLPGNIVIDGGMVENEGSKALPVYDPVSLPALMQKQFDGRDLTLGDVLDNNSTYTRYYITYKSGELTISGILNVPKGNIPAGGFPVLVLNHGHIDTSIYTNGRGLRREQDYFAKQGFAVLHPDYRNHAQSSKDPDAETNVRLGYVEDVINAVYAIKSSSLDFLHKENIGMLGHSMGGGITQAVIVTKPDLVKAAVLYAPVSMDVRDSFERWMSRNAETAKKISEAHGTPQNNPEFWDNISPITFVNNIKVPVRLYHGTADESVPLEWSQRSEKLLKENGKDVELIIYQNQPHEFTNQSWTNFMSTSAEFFKKYLK